MAITLFVGAGLASAAIISMNAGRVAGIIVTTREVAIHHLIDVTINAKAPKVTLSIEHPHARDFVRETTSTLLENAIFLEADSIAAVPISKEKIAGAAAQVQKKMKRNSEWLKLEVSAEELKRILTRTLRAKEFIKFKVDSAAIPISDREAEDYFNNNRLKFENLQFAKIKENIKGFLTKQQVDHRMKEWFELLQSKYHLQNQLGD